MQIHELNALGRNLTNGDQFVVDTGEVTAKIDYNALANAIVNALAVKKTGDTMTGDLQINKSLPAVYLATGGTTRAYIRHNGTGKYLQFVQFNPDNGKYENYYLPVADSESDISYNILTSKTPVTIAQGGTGATGTSPVTTLTPTNADSRIKTHNIYLYQWGKVCFLYARVSCDFSVTNFTPGSNLDLTVLGAPAPTQAVTSVAYNGANIIATRLSTAQYIRYRNTGATLTGNDVEMITSFTYLTA